MSDFLAESSRDTITLRPESTIEPISDETIALAKKVLNTSILRRIPDFDNYILELVTLNPSLIPVSQIQGYQETIPKQAFVSTQESTSSTTYTDLATVGPQFTLLGKGKYLAIFGFMFQSSSPDGYMSPSVNGATPTDSDAAYGRITSAPGNLTVVPSRAVVLTLTADGSNTIKFQYRVTSSTITFETRWAVIMRTGNP